MNDDAIRAAGLRDATHVFHVGVDGEFCRTCGGRRWAHYDDGHHALPEHKYVLADTKYRPGPHPYWYRPGAFNRKSNTKTPHFPAQNPSDGGLGRTQPDMP